MVSDSHGFFPLIQASTTMLRIVVFIIISMLFTALNTFTAAAGASDSQGERAGEGVCDDQINIGSSVVLTGPLAQWGNDLARIGPRAYFNTVNERGGVYGRRIRYTIYNDFYRSDRALTNVKKLIQKDRILCLFLQTGTSTNRSSYRYATEQKGVPLMFPASGAHFWTFPFKRLIFPLSPSYKMQTYILIDYFVLTRGFKKIGIFYHDDPFGQEVVDAARERLRQHGLQPSGEEKLKTEEFEVSGQLMKLRRQGAEAVVLGVPYNYAFRFIREARKLGWGARLGGIGMTSVQTLLVMSREAALGYVGVMTMPDARFAAGPAMEEYRRRLRKRFQGAPYNSSTLTGWWAAKLLTEILRRAGRDLSRENMIRAAESIRGYDTGITAPISFFPDDHSGTTSAYLAVALAADAGQLRFVPLRPDSKPEKGAPPFWISSWDKSTDEVAPLYRSLGKFTAKRP